VKLNVPETLLGKKVRCATCSTAFQTKAQEPAPLPPEAAFTPDSEPDLPLAALDESEPLRLRDEGEGDDDREERRRRRSRRWKEDAEEDDYPRTTTATSGGGASGGEFAATWCPTGEPWCSPLVSSVV